MTGDFRQEFREKKMLKEKENSRKDTKKAKYMYLKKEDKEMKFIWLRKECKEQKEIWFSKGNEKNSNSGKKKEV